MTARTLSALALALAMLVPTGCRTARPSQLDETGPIYAVHNYQRPEHWPADVRRVAVLPAADATGSLPLNFMSTYDAPWLQALQQSQRAEFVPVDRATYARWTGTPRPPASTALLPADWPARIRSATGADAVLLLDVTHCSPYPPLALGLRAKLVRLDTGEMIWSADEIFDAADPLVARGARHHLRSLLSRRKGHALSAWQSPSHFASYVADAVVAVLPSR